MIAGLFLLAACESKGKYDSCIESECLRCHGDSESPAPPADTAGRSDTGLLTVGAHREHLRASDWHAQIACSECHSVPACLNDEGHIDSATPAEMAWGPLATSGAASPLLDRSGAACSGVYCHGSTLIAGGSLTRPVWTRVDGTQASCGTCHGLPPASPHPDEAGCYRCHGNVVDRDMTFVDGSLHVNGRVDIGFPSACSTCHGSADNPAPPVYTTGGSDTSLVTVGAHQAHLGPGGWHREVLCQECHLVPADASSPGHMDGPPAELTWSGVAVADGAFPLFDRPTAVCSSVYCHGSTLPAGGGFSPVWTQVDGSQAACGSCHGLPPGPPHTADDRCIMCHSEVVGPDRSFVNASLHIDGVVNVSLSPACNACHGNTENSAPPVDVSGGSDTSLLTVGAHQQHLGASSWHKEVTCDTCHVVPASLEDPGHLDSPPAELTWTGVAVAAGASPLFDGSSGQCASVYCHGETLDAGGSLTRPVWTTVNGTQAACGTCHDVPPPSPHPHESECDECHESVYEEGFFNNPALHVNGRVDF